MKRTVQHASILLRALFRRMQWAALGAAMAALGLLPFLSSLEWGMGSTGFLVALWLGYFARKTYLTVHCHQAVAQLRLEERFIAQSFDSEPMGRCLRQTRHLWARSRTFQALRRVLANPLPHLLLVEEKRRRVRRFFHRAFRPHRFRWRWADGVLLAAGFGTFLFLPATFSLNAATLALLLSALFLLAAEVAQSVLHRRLHARLDDLEMSLSRWTLAERQHGTLRDDARKPYRHTLLFYAHAWFDQPATASTDASPLREVA